jgi:hypothetical protein
MALSLMKLETITAVGRMSNLVTRTLQQCSQRFLNRRVVVYEENGRSHGSYGLRLPRSPDFAKFAAFSTA